MFATETTRRIKNPPALSVELEMGIASPLFPARGKGKENGHVNGDGNEAEEADETATVQTDLVSELWGF